MKWIVIYEADNEDIIDEFGEETYLFFEGTDEMRQMYSAVLKDGDDVDSVIDAVTWHVS